MANDEILDVAIAIFRHQGIILQKEKVCGIPNFVITNLLLGCCTTEGKATFMNA